MAAKHRVWVCPSAQLVEGKYWRVDVKYSGVRSSVVIFRMDGQCLAYRNQCVHMPRELDCEVKTIFDKSGKQLRCSMHGIVYDPKEGASLSAICHGEKLTSVSIEEDKDGVWITDKRVRTIDDDAL